MIAAEDVTNEVTDYQQLANVALAAKANLELKQADVVADAGYYNAAEGRCVEAGLTPFCPRRTLSAPSGVVCSDLVRRPILSSNGVIASLNWRDIPSVAPRSEAILAKYPRTSQQTSKPSQSSVLRSRVSKTATTGPMMNRNQYVHRK